jgi:hypothetical protein
MSEGYEEQIPLYEKMYELALEQEKCVREGEVDTDRLIALINQRQELISSLEAMQAKIGELKGKIVAILGILEFSISGITQQYNGTAVTQLAATMEKSTAFLVKIKDLDKINEETLRYKIKETADNLQHIQKEKKAKNAYQNKMVNNDGVFVDFSK